jgi:hypothetical protein
MAESCNLTPITNNSSPPGADSNTYPLYNSVTCWQGKRFPQMYGFKRLLVDIKCSQNGTLKWYKSSDRGANWLQIGERAVTAPAANDTEIDDYLIEEYDDFKLDWVNSGSAQATWNVSIALSDSRNPGA